VKTGLQALGDGRVVKVVGGFNRLLPFMDRLMPRPTIRWLMGVSAKPPRTMRAEKEPVSREIDQSKETEEQEEM